MTIDEEALVVAIKVYNIADDNGADTYAMRAAIEAYEQVKNMGVSSIDNAWDEFKAVNDKRLQEIERKSSPANYEQAKNMGEVASVGAKPLTEAQIGTSPTSPANIALVKKLVEALRKRQYSISQSSFDEAGAALTEAQAWLEKEQPDGCALDKALKELAAEADNEYCRALDMGMATLCCGEEWKINNGKFGQPELDAHRKQSKTMERHYTLHYAVKKIRAALATAPKRESVEPTTSQQEAR